MNTLHINHHQTKKFTATVSGQSTITQLFIKKKNSKHKCDKIAALKNFIALMITFFSHDKGSYYVV